MSIGERLREQKYLRKMNSTQLAEKIGISKTALSQIEGGTYKPSADVIIKICSALNISADYLLTGKEPYAKYQSDNENSFNNNTEVIKSLTEQNRILTQKIIELQAEIIELVKAQRKVE